jgi:hypothetical protein
MVFALTLLPLLMFNLHHPGVLQSRFHSLTYITPPGTVPQIAIEFVRRYLRNLNVVHWVVWDDSNPGSGEGVVSFMIRVRETRLLVHGPSY